LGGAGRGKVVGLNDLIIKAPAQTFPNTNASNLGNCRNRERETGTLEIAPARKADRNRGATRANVRAMKPG
jgi:hypothetical protein